MSGHCEYLQLRLPSHNLSRISIVLHSRPGVNCCKYPHSTSLKFRQDNKKKFHTLGYKYVELQNCWFMRDLIKREMLFFKRA